MFRHTRDPKKIVRDLETSIRLRDIREWVHLKEALSMGFWEFFLLAGLFCFGIGVLTTLVYVIPPENPALYYFMLLWTAGFLIMSIVTFEFLIRKFRTIRRALELSIKRMERLEREVFPQERAKDPSPPLKQHPPTEQPPPE